MAENVPQWVRDLEPTTVQPVRRPSPRVPTTNPFTPIASTVNPAQQAAMGGAATRNDAGVRLGGNLPGYSPIGGRRVTSDQVTSQLATAAEGQGAEQQAAMAALLAPPDPFAGGAPAGSGGGGRGGGGGGGRSSLLATIQGLRQQGQDEIAAALEQNLSAIDVAREQYGEAVLQSEAVRKSSVGQVLQGLDETATGRAADLQAQGVTGGAGQAAFDSVRAVIEGMGVSQEQLSGRFAEIQESIFQDYELSANQISQVSQDALAAVSLQAEMAVSAGGGGGRGGGGGGGGGAFEEASMAAIEALMAEGLSFGQAMLIVGDQVPAGVKGTIFKQGTEMPEGPDPTTFALQSGAVGIGEGGFVTPEGVPISSAAAEGLGASLLVDAEREAGRRQQLASRGPLIFRN